MLFIIVAPDPDTSPDAQQIFNKFTCELMQMSNTWGLCILTIVQPHDEIFSNIKIDVLKE